MATKYATEIAEGYADIAQDGTAVKFPGAAPGIYDPITNTWSGSATGDVYGKAVQIEGDPDSLSALGLIGQENVTLLVANRFTSDAEGTAEIAFEPDAPMAFEWPVGGRLYTTKQADDVAPDGTAIVYTLTGGV